MNFKNAMIYTEEFRFVPGAFSVENGKFSNVLGAPQADAVDLHGAYVIPGLIDVHSHGNSGADFSYGSVPISSMNRCRPAKPLENISAKLASLRMGLTKVVTYREKVMRST